jgi:hypothetical protein
MRDTSRRSRELWCSPNRRSPAQAYYAISALSHCPPSVGRVIQHPARTMPSAARLNTFACCSAQVRALKRRFEAATRLGRTLAQRSRSRTTDVIAATSALLFAWSRNRSRPAASHDTDSGSPRGLGTMYPHAPSRPTCSRAPPTSLIMTGNPADKASIDASGQPSKNEFNTNPSAAASRADGFGRFSRRWILSRSGRLSRSLRTSSV